MIFPKILTKTPERDRKFGGDLKSINSIILSQSQKENKTKQNYLFFFLGLQVLGKNMQQLNILKYFEKSFRSNSLQAK